MYKILNQLHEMAGISGVLPAPAINTEDPEEKKSSNVEIYRIEDDTKSEEDCGCDGDEGSCECDDAGETDPVEDIVSKFRDFIQQNMDTLPSDPEDGIDVERDSIEDDASDGLDTDEDPAAVTDEELDGMDATEDDLDVSDELEAVENEELEADPEMGAEDDLADPEMDANPELGAEDDMADPEAGGDIGDGPDELEEPNRQGTIRVIKGAHLVYKRKTPDGFYEELWFYNIGRDSARDELELRKNILSGTDIPESATKSDDGAQSYDIWTSGNGQMMKVIGLPN